MNGVVVAMGAKAGVPTPVNSAVVSTVKEVEGKPFVGLDEKALIQLSETKASIAPGAGRPTRAGGGAAAGEGGGGSGAGSPKPVARSRKKGYKKR